jgi:hypothetical protein
MSFSIPLTISCTTSSGKKKVITTKECINLEMLDKIISLNKLSTDKWTEEQWGMIPPFDNEVTQIQEYRKKFKKSSNVISVKYTLTSPTGYGRVYPEKSLSLCSFRRALRHTLAKNLYADIDIKNCQPVLLEQICVSNGITCTHISEYVRNRDNIFKEYMEYYECTKDQIKNLFIRLMFFGTFDSWAEDYNITKEQTEFVINLRSELMRISNIIKASNPDLLKKVEKAKKKNENASLLSLYLQEWERRILECIYEYMIREGILTLNDPVVLCFDGIMIPIEKYTDELLITLKSAVAEEFNISVDFCNKEMNEDFINELDMQEETLKISPPPSSPPSLFHEEDIEEVIDENKLYHIDFDYLDSLITYKGKKKYFENFVTKIMDPPCYIFNRARGDERIYDGIERPEMYFSIQTENDLIKMFKNFHFVVDGKKISFINTWLYDSKIKTCCEMDFIPSNTCTRKDGYYYNLFSGYSSYINTPFTVENTQKTLTQFFRIGRELCGGNQEYFDYLLHYFAHMIQKPAERIPICIIIKGSQGVGKNVWLNAIGNILNQKNYITTANPRDLFGEYAEGFYHKLLVNLNECEGRETFDFEGRIKSFITEDSITINAKYQRPITIQNHARLIIFSNKATPISIDVKSGDRRYVVFQTTDEMLKIQNRDEYWRRAVEGFKKPEFIARLYDYFNTLDIENYNFIKNRPITEAYREMCKMFIPTEALFFEDFIDECKFELVDDEDNNDKCLFPKENNNSNIPLRLQSSLYRKEFQVVGSQLYKDYTQWAKSKGFHKEYSPSIKQFYGKMNELQLPIQKFKSSETRLKFIPENVYNYLINKKWIAGADGEEVLDNVAPQEQIASYEDLFD